MKRKSLLFLLLLALIAPWAANAQNTLTVCEGTATNAYIPVYGYYADTEGCNSEFIIPSSELGALNGGVISSMTFYLASPASAAWGAEFQVYLGTVEGTTLSANLGPDDFTVVYTGVLDGTGSTMVVTFDNPYAYNGGNLLVGTIITAEGSYKSATFNGIEATGAAYYSYEGWSGIVGGVQNFIPQTTFTYTGGTAVTCFKPKNLAATLTPGNGTVATLTWERNDNGTEDAWVVEYGTAADFAGATTVNVSGTPTKNLTGLTPETTYYARVKPDCDTDGTLWSTSISFTPTDAYSITVNEGTATNGYVPIYGFYVDNKSYSQFIIPSEELRDITYGTISKMTFYSSTASAPWNNAQFEVYMMETTESTLSALTDWTEMDLVMNAAHLEISNSQMEVALDNPFQYMGGNLMIGIKQTVSGTYLSCTWLGVAAEGASMGGYGTSVSQKNFLPKTTFEYFPGEEPSCFKPTGLTVSNVTNHTAELSWTENGDARSWEISYTIQGNETIVQADAIPFTLTGLEPEAEYTVKVRAACGDNDYSEWTATQTFTTLVACEVPSGLTVTDLGPYAATLNWTSEANSFNVRYRVAGGYEAFWEDDFENGLGQWTILHGDDATAPASGYWYTIDPSGGLSFNAVSGTKVASSWSWNSSAYNADNYLITPQVDLQGVVKFYVRTNAGYPDQYEVLLSTTGNTIADFTVTLQDMAIAPDNGEWNEVVIPLTGYTGQGYIAIHHQDYDANYLCIDDFGIYEVIPAGSWIEATANTTTLAITGLTDETDYEWQVQAVCGGEDGSSEWSSMSTFHTPSNCEVPANLTTTDIDASSATLNWDGIQDSYNVQYRVAAHRDTYYFTNFNTSADREGWTWTGYIIYGMADPVYGYPSSENYMLQMGWSTTDETYIISPELPEYPSGSRLEFYHIINQNPNTFQVGFSSTTNDVDAFTWSDPIDAGANYTLYNEEIPDGVKYVAFKATALEIDEEEDSGPYAVLIDNFGIFSTVVPAGDWIDATANTTTLDITGLDGKTEYEWHVQGVNTGCAGGVTEWSEIASFTTEASCLVPTDLYVDEVTSTSAVVSWTSDATLFDIEVNGEVIEGVSNPYTLEDLDPETIYEVRVLANCGDGDYSDWTDYFDFVTDCGGAKELPYEFGFDIADIGEFYACWTALSWSSANDVGLAYDPADNTNIVFRFSSVSQDEDDEYEQILISPELEDIEAPVQVSFDYKIQSATWPESFMVLYTTVDYTSLDDFEVVDDITAENTGEFATYTTTLPAGTKYVMLYYYSDYAYYLFIDNFSFTEAVGETQTIELTEGWNWFSTFVENDDPVALLDMLKEALGENAIEIQSYDDNTEYFDGEWFGGLDDTGITNDQMYMILVANDCTIELEGPVADPANYPITINPGWSWVGFPYNQELDIAIAFADFNAVEGDVIQSRNDQTEFDGDDWFGDIETLIPGEGVMYFSNSDEVKTLIINTAAKNGRSVPVKITGKIPSVDGQKIVKTPAKTGRSKSTKITAHKVQLKDVARKL